MFVAGVSTAAGINLMPKRIRVWSLVRNRGNLCRD